MRWRQRVAAFVLVAVAGGLVGAAQVRQADAAGEPHRITVPAGAFAPTSSQYEYRNYGYWLQALGGGVEFVAPVFFPVDVDHVRITNLIMRAYDNGPGQVCVSLRRAQHAGLAYMAQTCSSGAATQDPRVFATTSISPSGASGGQALYLWLDIGSGALTYKFYSVIIEWVEV